MDKNNIIFKYKLTTDITRLNLPEGAEVLSVHKQGPDVCIWVFENTSNDKCQRVFEIIPTGMKVHDIDNPKKFIGTVLMHEERLVFHVFERL